MPSGGEGPGLPLVRLPEHPGLGRREGRGGDHRPDPVADHDGVEAVRHGGHYTARPVTRQPPVSRVLRPDGKGVITRIGIRGRRASDLYHFLLTASWPPLLAIIVGSWLLAHGVFACAYLALGDAIGGAERGSVRD